MLLVACLLLTACMGYCTHLFTFAFENDTQVSEPESKEPEDTVPEGFAQQTLSYRLDDNGATVTLSGLLPEKADAKVTKRAGTKRASSNLFSFDIAFNESFSLKDPITVTLSDPLIRDALDRGEEIGIIHVAEDGTKKLLSSDSADGAVVFQTTEFSEFNVVSAAAATLEKWSGDCGSFSLVGYGVSLSEIDVKAEEGVSVLKAYSAERDLFSRLSVEIKDGTKENREKIAVRTVKDGSIAGEVTKGKDPDTSFALVLDSGFRNRSVKNGNVSLSGVLPKNLTVTAEDVRDRYGVLTGDNDRLLAAYDITLNESGSEYEPDKDHPVEVTMALPGRKSGSSLTLVHILDDGTQVPVDFVTEGESIRFNAESFSVYVVIEHETGTVVTPRVQFHFIADGATELSNGSTAYYEGSPYSFRNKHGDMQNSQILSDGETLEFIADPENRHDKFFYGWYMVNPFVVSGTTDEYGIGTDGTKLYYTWPAVPASAEFESTITINESNVSIGDTVTWSLGSLSGSGTVDSDGNVHVFLAPLFENYNFINFMLYAKDVVVAGSNSLMARKMIALGSSPEVSVKISDIRSTSTDPVHLIFTGWEYNAGTDTNPSWVTIQTVDYTGAEVNGDSGGVYLNVSLADTTSIDLYPVFIEARWVDFFSGVTESGASYVPSRFLESWASAAPVGMYEQPGVNIFTQLETSVRAGYDFDGWYAFAVTDSNGNITNLVNPAPVTVSYIDVTQKYLVKTVTVNTTAIRITNADGSIAFSGECALTDNGDGTGSLSSSGPIVLFSSGTTANSLKFRDDLDRLTLYANWAPASSQITVVYWTEVAQDKDYVAPAAGHEKDDYKAGAVKVITTAELNAQSAAIGTTFSSGSAITLAELQQYTENSVSILATANLDDVGAVLAGEEKFYDLNTTLSDASVTINGDGSTTFNVYYSRKTFKIVFHIGRDGYVKTGGQQKTTDGWDPYGNWIQYMYNDPALRALIGHDDNGQPYYNGLSQAGVFSMTYNGVTYDSTYVTNSANIMGDYVPADDENVYVITAKYGAYIGDRWPTPVNPAFTFTDPSNARYTMYIWAAYYGSLYGRIANERPTYGNQMGNNPDINGIYEYMSAELCSNRAGDDIINANQVHHLVAYFGTKGKAGIIKNYHIYYEAIDGTYDPANVTLVSGSDFLSYRQTSWSATEGSRDAVNGHTFYLADDTQVISNLEPEYQLATTIDGYEPVYSCYNTPQTNDHHIYFFYRPKQYTLTFNLGDSTRSDNYYYTQSLADADKYTDLITVPEGHYFQGWYTNEAGIGEPFDFASEHMPSQNVVLYPILKVYQYIVKLDPNGAVIDHRTNASMATYFTADYGEQVGEYSLSRTFIRLTDKELTPGDPTYYTGTKYYYINTQRLEIASEGEWGLPTELRNAVYVAEDQIDSYYNWYCDIIDNADPTWWTGVQKLSKSEFLSTYASYPYRPISSGEHYTGMGWYQVHDDGTVATMPFNFNDPVTGPLTLRALWRLDGGLYIQYNPYYVVDDGEGHVTTVAGELSSWTDPENPSMQLYADQSIVNILHAPTNTTSGWIFRGWRVVKAAGTATYEEGGVQIQYIIWEPFQLDSNNQPVYYQPGDVFIVDSELVSERPQGGVGAIIHMQAYYEPEDDSYRRPYVTNLILDANSPYKGYVNTSDSTSLPPIAGPGSEIINTESNIYNGHPTQILLGDFQSNVALHLYQYATSKTFHSVTGTNFFTNQDGHFLIGFDEESDPVVKGFVPTYMSDSVISVTRNEINKVLYAMWEPMVYVTFVNTTAQDITIDLTGSGANTVSIVNQITGEFDRERLTTTIVVPAKSGDVNGSVKVVMPRAEAGTDSVIATAVNDHVHRKITVSGEYPSGIPYGTGSTDIRYGNDVTYTGTLVTDATGIIVTYTEVIDAEVLYDVNGGTWTDTAPYAHLGGDRYVLDANLIVNNAYRPTDPERTGYLFLGWTTNADVAAHTDFGSASAVTWGDTTITPDADGNVLDKVRSDYLWDFSRDYRDLSDEEAILYAVWSEYVTVTFNVSMTNSANHNWTGPATSSENVPYTYYRSSETARTVTYTMAKGDRVLRPDDPTPNSDHSDWIFYRWAISSSFRNTAKAPSDAGMIASAFDFSERIVSDMTLYTSWSSTQPQYFTFTVENHVEGGNPGDSFDYTIAVSDEKALGKIGNNSGNVIGTPDRLWGSLDVSMKNNEKYTIRVIVSYITNWGGANGIEIEVYDKDGRMVKTGQVIYCNGNTYKNFVSDYKYTLTVAQAAKTGYETTVTPGTPSGNIDFSKNDASRTFTFLSKMRRTTTGNLAAQAQQEFAPDTNSYVAGEDNSLTVVFNNKGAVYVAPTGYDTDIASLLWISLLGLMLVAGALIGILQHRGKRGDVR